MNDLSLDLSQPGRIIFGRGAASRLGELSAAWGRRAFLVTGRGAGAGAGLLEHITGSLTASGVEWVHHIAAGEPDTSAVDSAAESARRESCDLVVGVGGGAALDAAKAVAGLAAAGGAALDYMEVVGDGRPLPCPALPMIAVPTTAGTGTEVTRNAVLTSREHGVKASLRSHHLLPRTALVDPELTRTLPPPLTAATGLDALTQLVESYVSRRANVLTNALAREGITRAGRSLRRACTNGGDMDARTDMALAALISGITLANAGLGAVHGIAGPLGGRLPAPHGAVCARLLPEVMTANFHALRERDPDNPALDRLVGAAAALLDRRFASPEEAVYSAAAWIRDLCEEMGIPGLASYGLGKHDLPPLAEAAARASSMKGNPIGLSADDLVGIMKKAME